MYLPALSETGKEPKPDKELLNGGIPNYNIYKTKDNKFIFFGALEQKFFKEFLQKLNLDNFSQKDKTEIKNRLTKIFSLKNLSEWSEFSKHCDCCLSPVNDLKQAISDEHLNELGLFRNTYDLNNKKIIYCGFPAGFTKQSIQPEMETTVPKIGEHTIQILNKILKYDELQINNFIKKNVVLHTQI